MKTPKYLLLATILLAGCGPSPETAQLASVNIIQSPTGAGASLPRLTAAPDGRIWLSWVEPGEETDANQLLFSVLDGEQWAQPVSVVYGTDWFINWADFPSVAAMGEKRVAAHWLTKKPGGVYAYDVSMAMSDDGGITWGSIVTPHIDGTATEHGFVTLFPVDEDIGAVWLDGRNMVQGGETDAANDHAHGGGMTLRYGRLDMAGRLVDEALLDELTCDCCQTGATVADSGPVVVYRDRTEDEIRDIYVTAYRDGSWTKPYSVANDDWHMTACPVNGPAIDSRRDQVAIAWFTAARDRPRVQVAFSNDGGRTFGESVEIDAGKVLGRVGLAMRDDGSAVVSWLAMPDGELAAIHYRLVTTSGDPGPIGTVANVSGARRSGVPQISIEGDRLVFAWTVPGEPSRVQTATVELAPVEPVFEAERG